MSIRFKWKHNAPSSLLHITEPRLAQRRKRIASRRDAPFPGKTLPRYAG